ncbi:MAG: hypothetical protein ACYS9T_12245 [Planctomycetota bacterium]|jgi:hypothetical protein
MIGHITHLAEESTRQRESRIEDSIEQKRLSAARFAPNLFAEQVV